MSQIVTQNPGSSEIQSPLIAGITEGLNKLSAVLNLKTGTLEDVQLTAVSIDNEGKNKNRIYEANFGNRLWLSFPAPVIKKNGSEITQSGSNFTIDYIGGSITFSADSKPADGDTITVSATYIVAESESLNAINTALSAVQTQSNKYKGNYDNVGALQLAHSSAENGDYAIVFDPLAVYAWKNDGWYDTRSIEDLSDYYNKEETNNLLGQKEPTIQQKGTSSSDDDYYWGGRKTWQDFKEKVRSTVLTGLSTASDAAVSAADTLLVAVGKLQAQVSKATQRAYLTGTGAPSTSTVGAVGQRYVNTSNGDEYTCEEVSGDTYTWRLHTRSVNGKRPTTPGGNIELEAADVGAAKEENGISIYTHSRSGNVNEFTGTGPNGRALMTANIESGDTFTVNGVPVTAYMGSDDAAGSMAGSPWNGKWVTFVIQGGVISFAGGAKYEPPAYSLAEQPTSETWIDGKMIYKKTYAGTSNTANVLLESDASYIDKLLDAKTSITTRANIQSVPGFTGFSDNSMMANNQYSNMVYLNPDGNLIFETTKGIMPGYSEWFVTVYYTKK